MFIGTPFIPNQWGSLTDVGMPPTWEMVVTYLLKPPDFGNLRDGRETRSSGFFFSVSSPFRDARNVRGCTGTLGELVGSHTKVAIYSTYLIHCKRL